MFSLIKQAIHLQPKYTPITLFFQVCYMFSRKKRVRDLQEVKITLQTQQKQIIDSSEKPSYVALREQINKLNWQSMQFDKLCGLPQKTLQLINIEIKKDKFNVDDEEFYQYSQNQLKNQLQTSGSVGQKLNRYYLRLYYLLMNSFQQYDQISQIAYGGHQYYKNEMYIMDLPRNTKLKEVIQYFISHINQPNKLDIVAQPSFIKHLLSIKRELMLQGVQFQTPKQQRKRKIQKIKRQSTSIKQKQEIQDSQQADIDQIQQQDMEIQNSENAARSKIEQYIKSSLAQSKIDVKIVKVLGYQYQFWVDVKHNRSKNGVEEDYIIEQRQIDNPNESILIKKQFPTIKVKYMVHKKKRKNHSMHFCIKSTLLVNIQGSLRNIKIQWRGPSNNYKQNMEEVSFIIIDYENIMQGNPTIRPIFFF